MTVGASLGGALSSSLMRNLIRCGNLDATARVDCAALQRVVILGESGSSGLKCRACIAAPVG